MQRLAKDRGSGIWHLLNGILDCKQRTRYGCIHGSQFFGCFYPSASARRPSQEVRSFESRSIRLNQIISQLVVEGLSGWNRQPSRNRCSEENRWQSQHPVRQETYKFIHCRNVSHFICAYISATVLDRYVEELDSLDDVEKYNPPPFVCLIEEKKTDNSVDVSLGMISICPSTGDVVWDDYEGNVFFNSLPVIGSLNHFR